MFRECIRNDWLYCGLAGLWAVHQFEWLVNLLISSLKLKALRLVLRHSIQTTTELDERRLFYIYLKLISL